MKPGEASSTAEFNALFRAIESSRRPASKRLFDDPLASGFLGDLKYVHRLSCLPVIGRLVPLYIDWKWPGVRTAHIGRTCWIDDQLRAALQDGVGQVVILGAGYDCRVYRLPEIRRIHVFELDHPSTLKLKVEHLRQLLDTIPRNVTFVEIDFDRQNLATALEPLGFDRSVPAFFLLEGLLHYLTAEAVDETLRSIASLSAPRSRLVFTYIHRGLLDGSVLFGDMGHVPSTLQESGETWTFGLDPEEIASYLAERGFELICDVGSTQYRAQYMGISGHHLKGFEFYRIALAEAQGI